MIKALYETHLQVSNLDEAIKFYEMLGLPLLSRSGNRIAFMMIGPKGKHQELGLWQMKEGEQISRRHFAFEVELEDLLTAKEWLNKKGIQTIGALAEVMPNQLSIPQVRLHLSISMTLTEMNSSLHRESQEIQ